MMSSCAQWGVEETCQYLRKEGLKDLVDIFREQKITGIGLRELTYRDLEEMGITNLGYGPEILYRIRKPWQIAEQGKVFNDPIHGHIELHPLLIKIIDTPQFQRLRHIKQLGGAYFVYPGASHNRFEHSIGVGHLAGELVQALNTRQPELLIDRRDILCVQIAGLCHDLGHGPFSHMFDHMFIPQAHPQLKEEEPKKLKHESISCKMFDHLVKCNELEKVMEQYGLVLSEDLDFIKEMIVGPPDTNTAQGQEWSYKGRTKDKSFLYEIVANTRNGMDVDKFDYFARDCYHLGIQNNFDYRRFLKFARVCEVDGQKQICMRDKEKDNMTDMFHTRYSLHRRACQHRVNTIIQAMIKDAFLKADKYIEIEGSGGKLFTLSTAMDDMEAYTKLTDQVFEQILNSSSKELAEARKILQRIISRKLYNFLGDIESETPTEETILEWKEELAKELNQGKREGEEALTPEDIEVIDIDINYGMKKENPVDKIHFYSKQDPTKARQLEESKTGPKCFSNHLIRFCCKKRGRDHEADKKCFDQWRRNKGFKDPDEVNL